MEKQKLKKQIYVWPRNIEFFNSLQNKSKFLNLLMVQYQESQEGEDGTASN